MEAQVASNARVLEPAAHEHGRAVDRACRDDHGLARADDRETVLAVADERADAVAPRRRGRVLVERLASRERGSRRRGKQEALDRRLDGEPRAMLGGVLEPADGTTLLLAIDAAIAAEAAGVLGAAGVLLQMGGQDASTPRPSQKYARPAGEDMDGGTYRDLRDRVAELLRPADEHPVRLVVLEVLVRNAHPLTDRLDRASVVGREEEGQVVLLGPLLAQEVLRAKGSRPVDCGTKA